MNPNHEEFRAQLRAKGKHISEQPKIGSKFDPARLRGKNALRWAVYGERKTKQAAPLQLWAAP
ncbi:hypothetical protein ACT3UJ_02200 [Halomonas sp. 86]|uniref:hypothetical protein n=1 Tax=unclassified Halomonas TaxID=2609666 RepID=UPI004033A7C0